MRKAIGKFGGRGAACAATLTLLAACAPAWLSPLERDHALAGRIWDARAQRMLDERELLGRAAAAHLLILGETHDNADHHRLQARVLAGMLRGGRVPALALEQFDREHQTALDAAMQLGEKDPEAIAQAGHFDRRGWNWPDYRPLVRLAADHGLRLIAANLSRVDARALMRSVAAGAPPAAGLPPGDPGTRAALERDIVEGHCGMPMSPALIAGMVQAQRARDAQMAASMQAAGAAGAVLIAGAAHARRDRGAPLYLSEDARSNLLVVAFVEVEKGREDPRDYLQPGSYDLVWFTPQAAREDPCAPFRRQGREKPAGQPKPARVS